MAKYNLTGSLETEFVFAVGDKEFTFRKPTVREMRGVAAKFAALDKEKDPDKQLKMSDEAMDEIYKFVTPLNHNSALKDVLDDQPVGVQTAFNDMIKKEIGAQE